MKKIKKILLKGISACPGMINGQVFIIKHPSSMAKVKKGRIIVAPFTTPIIAPAVSQAVGLITEMGGLTCHAAIVAREFGIPCVVGVKGATKILKNGQRITLDANKRIIYER